MDKDDQHVQQLKEIFLSFCTDGCAGLNKDQLLELCNRLSLEGSCLELVVDLAFPNQYIHDGDHLIYFDRFCDCFIAALSEVGDPISSAESNVHEENTEIKPRLVRGGRSYGRKSKPANPDCSDTADDVLNEKPDCNDNMKLFRDSNQSSDTVVISSDDLDKQSEHEEECYFHHRTRHDEKQEYFEAGGRSDATSMQGMSGFTSSNETFDCFAEHSSATLFGDNEINLFSSLDLDGSGEVEIDHVVELWKQGGVSEPAAIFQALGIHGGDGVVTGGLGLSTTLEKEVLSLLSSQNSGDSLTQALLISYKHHSHFVNSQVDHHRHQADKMRDDLERSELRNSKIIEEVDDRYVTIDQQNERRISNSEKKWAKKLNSVQRNFDRERDAIVSQSNLERDTLKKELDTLHEDDLMLRRKIDNLISENSSLTRESNQLCEKLSDAEKDAERLRKDLECLLAAKTSDMSDPINTSQEEKFALIIKEYEAQCRNLADKNDELMIEVESLRAKIRHQETFENYNNQNIYAEEKLLSPKRKKATRQSFNKMTHSMAENTSDMDSEPLSNSMESSELGHISPSRSNKGSPFRNSQNFSNARMIELESLVEELRRERRHCVDNFIDEKNKLRADLEKEFQLKLEKEKTKFSCYDDNKAVEEQQNMTMRLLKDMTKQKDELDVECTKLKDSLMSLKSSNQQGMADLCREFANEKSELVTNYNEKVKDLEEKLDNINQKLKDEEATNGRFAEQLKNERLQHQEALSAHQEIITKFERSTLTKSSSLADVENDNIRTLKERHDNELVKLKQSHALALEAVKHETEEKLDQILSERQQFQESTSMCSELERLQENIGVERREMHKRMEEMRAAFEHDAAELKQLLDCDKAKLRKQLSEEVALLRQRLAEDTEREIKRKRQHLEEEEELLRKKEQLVIAQTAEVERLEGKVEDLKMRNIELVSMLSKSNSALHEQEEEVRRIKETSRDADVTHLEERVREMNKKVKEKEHLNFTLRQQLADVNDERKEKLIFLSNLQTNLALKSTEISQLKQENVELAEKLSQLECERLANRVETAGLAAKCEELERSRVIPPVPSPRSCHNRNDEVTKDHREENKKENGLLKEKMKLMQKEIGDLQNQLAEKSDEGIQPLGGDNIIEIESVTSNPSENVLTCLRGRLNKTRTQLTDQMKKSKDLYSKLAKTELLVKDLYSENAHLMRALQVTEARQKDAERKLLDERDRCRSLGNLLQKVSPQV
ncbi:uncharacterized protein LOC143446407 [Clavelina lepadiformis]|uniref:uncharacterized protein LOC143446407 n=1 Tax=Clavelina lepadiformis TaxID=159417 RepID=UPI0040432C82